MVMPVASFVLVQTSEFGSADSRAQAATTRGQDLRLHYLCSGVYLIPVASSADFKTDARESHSARPITVSMQCTHIPKCRSGPGAQCAGHSWHHEYVLYPLSRVEVSVLMQGIRHRI